MLVHLDPSTIPAHVTSRVSMTITTPAVAVALLASADLVGASQSVASDVLGGLGVKRRGHYRPDRRPVGRSRVFNEYRAEKAAEALHDQIHHEAVVTRDGKPSTVDVTDLVSGDLVNQRLGDIARLMSG
jgi:hypothetical protein